MGTLKLTAGQRHILLLFKKRQEKTKFCYRM